MLHPPVFHATKTDSKWTSNLITLLHLLSQGADYTERTSKKHCIYQTLSKATDTGVILDLKRYLYIYKAVTGLQDFNGKIRLSA
jgi:hypothetical protein